MRVLPAFVVLLVATACASPRAMPAKSPTSIVREPLPASEIRQVAVFLRVAVAPGFRPQQAEALPGEYEGALLDALNARAIVVRDVRHIAARGPVDPGAITARAREVGADHAFIVDVEIDRATLPFCTTTRHAFTAQVTIWRQAIEILRAQDGVRRLDVSRPGVEVPDLAPDCDDPRSSEHRQGVDAASHAVGALLGRALRETF